MRGWLFALGLLLLEPEPQCVLRPRIKGKLHPAAREQRGLASPLPLSYQPSPNRQMPC
jgi:hypothetical protein